MKYNIILHYHQSGQLHAQISKNRKNIPKNPVISQNPFNILFLDIKLLIQNNSIHINIQ